jgi:hypothetical protein
MFHIMLSLERARVLFRRYSTDDVLFGQIAVIIMVYLYLNNTKIDDLADPSDCFYNLDLS